MSQSNREQKLTTIPDLDTFSIQVPEFYNCALKDEASLKEIIMSPESLLENLFEGVENRNQTQLLKLIPSVNSA